MKRPIKSVVGLTLGLLMATPGCQEAPPCDLANLTEDANGNSFPDITPPEGVPFDSVSNVKIRVRNEDTLADLAFLAPRLGIDPALLDIADITIRFSITLTYDNDAVQVLSCTLPLDAFEIQFEAACPRQADLHVEAVVSVPPLGTVAVVPVDLTLNVVDYACGSTVEFRTFVNENGELDETVSVS